MDSANGSVVVPSNDESPSVDALIQAATNVKMLERQLTQTYEQADDLEKRLASAQDALDAIKSGKVPEGFHVMATLPDPTRAARGERIGQVEAWLKANPGEHRPVEIAHGVGLQTNQIGVVLATLRAKGVVDSARPGLYYHK